MRFNKQKKKFKKAIKTFLNYIKLYNITSNTLYYLNIKFI
jgi:hypothetical protein